MKTRFTLMMAVVLAVALSGAAFAADAAAPGKPAAGAAAAAATPAAPAAPAAKAPQGVKATVKGTVASKTITRKGQDVKVYNVTVTEAKGEDGKALDNLKGAVLHLGPKPMIEEIAKFDGKTAEITGVVVEGKNAKAKMMRVKTIK